MTASFAPGLLLRKDSPILKQRNSHLNSNNNINNNKRCSNTAPLQPKHPVVTSTKVPSTTFMQSMRRSLPAGFTTSKRPRQRPPLRKSQSSRQKQLTETTVMFSFGSQDDHDHDNDSSSCAALLQQQHVHFNDQILAEVHVIHDHVRPEEEDSVWYQMEYLKGKRRDDIKNNLRARLYKNSTPAAVAVAAVPTSTTEETPTATTPNRSNNININLKQSQTMTWRGLEEIRDPQNGDRKTRSRRHVRLILQKQATLQHQKSHKSAAHLAELSLDSSHAAQQRAHRWGLEDEAVLTGISLPPLPRRGRNHEEQRPEPQHHRHRHLSLRNLAKSVTQSFSRRAMTKSPPTTTMLGGLHQHRRRRHSKSPPRSRTTENDPDGPKQHRRHSAGHGNGNSNGNSNATKNTNAMSRSATRPSGVADRVQTQRHMALDY